MKRAALVPLITIVLIGGGLGVPAFAALPIVNLNCGDTVDQSLKLGNDLLDCPGDGLRVDAPSIIIDLNGHRITHDNSSNVGDEGINNFAGFFEVTVRNGTISFFEKGIDIGDGGTHNRIEQMVVVANSGQGMSFRDGNQRVRGNTVAGNGSLGIELSDDDSSVQANLVYGNGQGGIELNGANDNVVAGNTFLRNGASYDGIYVDGDRNRLTNNVVSGSGEDGIDLNGDANKVLNNVLVGNGDIAADNGIEINGDDNVIKRTTASGNAGHGFFFDSGSDNILDKNVAHANGFAVVGDGIGIGIYAGAATADNGTNIARGNDDADECFPTDACKPNAGSGGTTDLNCGDPVTSSIVLGKDLLDCPEDGLVVDAPNITIDLNGHRISHDGPADPGEYAIDNNGGNDGLKVVNGELIGFFRGVWSEISTDNQIVNDIVAGSADNGIDLAGSNHVVKKSVVASNGNFGINLGESTKVLRSTITRNEFQGINLALGGHLIKGNHVWSNGDSGLTITAGDADVFQKNSMLANGNFGIFVADGDDMKIARNNISGNANSGVFYVAGENNVIDKNKTIANGYEEGVSDGAGFGIDAAGASGTTGKNVSFANDNSGECDPPDLC